MSLLQSASCTPEEAVATFAEAHNAGNVEMAAATFARDACFLTPDATAIRGREEIGGVLAQLVASGARIEIEGQCMLRAGEIALSVQRWTIHLAACGPAFAQASNATVVLGRLERRWRLLIVAPWGLGGGDRDRFMPVDAGRLVRTT